AVGESGSLHCRTFKKLIEKILLLMAIICRGDYHFNGDGKLDCAILNGISRAINGHKPDADLVVQDMEMA
ncbi:hypothetical protein, partial [Duganella sp. Leaf126]|uniref:hypothetical protein n=1 Tax=Duganella sp. Leaf126 TaxID=1736266 RepID=UPI001E320E54